MTGKDKRPGETQNPLLTVMPGFSLEEYYQVERSRSIWLDTKLLGHLQPTFHLLQFFKEITPKTSTNKAKKPRLAPNKLKNDG